MIHRKRDCQPSTELCVSNWKLFTSAMNGVNVRVVGSKIGVKVHILKVIAEGVGGGRPISPVNSQPAAYFCLATI